MVRKAGFEWVAPMHQRGTAMDYYAGIDVSLKVTNVCVVDSNGKIVPDYA